ncbi:MAG: 16S rRNA (uracil(1498)-N(3))-methyltransferase [Planctomycetes bacterium]|nr:16S rRNA (uracil(1498)-N(3))-methyltransferase [Planctomycetota bacterium]
MDRPPRFYVERLTAEEVALPPDEAHHARNVLRLGVGDEVELFNGRGEVARGSISAVKRASAVVRIESRAAAEPRSSPAVHLAFAVPRTKRLHWLLEKATELAAASLRPVIFERSAAAVRDAALLKSRLPRWLAPCIAAAKQSRMNWLPAIEEPLPLAEFLSQRLASPEGYCGVVGLAGGGARLIREVLADCPPGRDICLLVGPEGGLSRRELTAVLAAGFAPARLGRTVLRVETAAIALLAATVAARDDLPGNQPPGA